MKTEETIRSGLSMNSVTVHHTPAGLALESGKTLFLISEKDYPLLRRGQPVPVRDKEMKPLSPGKYAAMAAGKVAVYLQSETVIVPLRTLTDKIGIRRVLLSSPSCGATA